MYRSTNLKEELCMTVVCIMLVCNVPARKYYASQRVFNDLKRTRHTWDSLIRLLAHPFLTPSLVSKFLSLPVCHRLRLLRGEGKE
jgi:hypothetical protein